jgi:hypothetical protein
MNIRYLNDLECEIKFTKDVAKRVRKDVDLKRDLWCTRSECWQQGICGRKILSYLDSVDRLLRKVEDLYFIKKSNFVSKRNERE